MPFPILAGKAIVDTGFSVDNSLMVDSASNDYLHRSISSGGSNQIWTASAWFKRSVLGQSASIYCSSESDTTQNFRCLFINADDRVQCAMYNGGYTFQVETTALLRDHSSWYHILTAVDTTQGTAANRVKIYINGTLQSSFSTASYPDQNATFDFATTDIIQLVSSLRSGSSIHNSGYIAELHVLDGVAKVASDFGEFDEDSPTIWKPKEYDGSYGTNGFYLDFADSSALGNDVSGNNNDFTASGVAAINQATDSPTNNFCTMNPLVPTTDITFSEGNCKIVTHSSNDNHGAGVGTFGLTAGKWYWEVKIASLIANHTHGAISELTTELYQNVSAIQNDTGTTTWVNDDGGEVVPDSTATTADYGLYSDGDIMGIALDIDNYNISYYQNGSALVTDFNMSTTRGTIFPLIKTGVNTTSAVNFGGCSAFAISSAANDANGYGNFEHAPPSGYLALCSKNLGSDGG